MPKFVSYKFIKQYYPQLKRLNKFQGNEIVDPNKLEYFARSGCIFYEQNACKYLVISPYCLAFEFLKNQATDATLMWCSRLTFNNFFEQEDFKILNSAGAIDRLNLISSTLTAKNINYPKAIISFLAVFIALITCTPLTFHLVNNFLYLLQSSLKLYLLYKAIKIETIPKLISDTDLVLPIYTILIPLYQEACMVDEIIKYMQALNYPYHKKDIKIIVEEDDLLTIEAINKRQIPSNFQVIKVPFSLPRTKPKALNYAMLHAKGKYLAIYDAEDRPEVNQLLHAVGLFASLSDEYVCLQARLNFHNLDQGWLAKYFSIEYSLWFDYILKGLCTNNLPITLGGTSNHFKIEVLRRIGSWDAYNVTEDADLGLRLYLNGYKVFVMDSLTLEESPVTVKNWLYQRSRWIKGYMQTFLVFAQQPKTNMSFKQIVVTYIMIAMSVYSFFSLPWLVIMVLINNNYVIKYLWLMNSFFAFSYLYGAHLYIIIKAKNKGINLTLKEKLKQIFFIILWPSYFFLHCLASYSALWQIVTKPFAWNKTLHGKSEENAFNKNNI